ncbi:MAG: MucB/RseB C-terminal domain-containing protein [Acidiferrobacterales bacterium]
MSIRLLSLRWALFVLLLVVRVASADAGASAGESAENLLLKMSKAAHTLSYQGTFVYQYGDQIDTMRIFHKVENGKTRERLVSLNGAAREVIRTHREVECYLPDEKSVLVEHRSLSMRNFPAVLPQSLRRLEKHYIIEPGSSGRVAGHEVRAVLIEPRDSYRYGYQLWADRSSDLLLKSTLFDSRNHVVERFMFTNVRIGGFIPDDVLRPRKPEKGTVWYREGSGSVEPISGNLDWKVNRLPPGFVLSLRMVRTTPKSKTHVEHFVYSDGLAVVSVFVQRIVAGSPPDRIEGLTHVGAVHVFGRVIGDHQITVVGEVPAKTINMIGSSVVPVQ